MRSWSSSAFGVELLRIVGQNCQHQGLEIFVLDLVLEDVDFAKLEQLGAVFVASFADQQLKSKGSSVFGLGLFLGAFALGHGQRSDPHLKN